MRIRTIKPEFWTNEELSEISAEALLLAIGLLNYADDEGYFNANPALIKSAIFPIRETSRIDTVLLRELSKVGFIELFLGSDNRKYGVVKKFLQHQVINKPKASKIKNLCSVLYEYGIDTVVIPSGREGKGKDKEREKEKDKKEKITLENLSVLHIDDWLKEKRNNGKYLNHDENEILEIFKDYCKSKNKHYSDYVAAYRGAFKWDKCQPKENKNETSKRIYNSSYTGSTYAGKPTESDKIEAAVARVAEKFGVTNY